MSDEEDNVETTEETVTIEDTSIPRDQQEFDRVEFTPEQQKRFNRMYAQVKSQESIHKQLIEDNKKLVTRLTAIEARNLQKEVDTSISKLKEAKVKALELGDYSKADDIADEIAEVKAKAKEAEKEQEKLKVEDPKESPLVLPPDVQEKVASWVSAKDDDGNLLRPFVNPAHPQHQKFLKIAQIVLEDHDNNDIPVEQVISMVDNALEAYGLTKSKKTQPTKQKTANVLSGLQGSTSLSSPKPKLTNQQKYVARKMFAGDPKAEEKYIEALKDL